MLSGLQSDERPPWADRYFYARIQFGNIGVPDYTSERGTLPVYLSREIQIGLESVARVLSESRQEAEEGDDDIEHSRDVELAA